MLRELIEKLPHEAKGRQGRPLFIRYYLKRQPEGDGPTKTFGIYLHEFLRSDPDEHHSHPWRWGVALVLWDGYIEERISSFDGVLERRRRRPGSLVLLTARTRHRVILEPGARPWSLFLAGPRVTGWQIGNETQRG